MRTISYEVWQTYESTDAEGLRNAFPGCTSDNEYSREYGIFVNGRPYEDNYRMSFNNDEEELAEWSIDSTWEYRGGIIIDKTSSVPVSICESSLWKYEYENSEPVYWEHIYQGQCLEVYAGTNPPVVLPFDEAKEFALWYLATPDDTLKFANKTGKIYELYKSTTAQ